MSDQNWRPINAEDDGCAVLITYRNEAGEEHVHVADSWGVDLDSSIFHTLCWRQCSGDWPGCKSNCPLFTGPVTEWFEEQKRYETMPLHDPFSFIQNQFLVFSFLYGLLPRKGVFFLTLQRILISVAHHLYFCPLPGSPKPHIFRF